MYVSNMMNPTKRATPTMQKAICHEALNPPNVKANDMIKDHSKRRIMPMQSMGARKEKSILLTMVKAVRAMKVARVMMNASMICSPKPCR